MMRILLLSIGMAVAISGRAQTIYPSGVSGCIARWTFDDESGNLTTIQDVSGNNNHGNNNNIVSVAGWKGGANKAGKFNGVSSWSNVAHSNTLNCPSEVTMVLVGRMQNFNSNPCNFSQFLSKGYPHFIAGNYGFGIGDGPFDNDCNTFSPNNMQLVPQCGSAPFNPPVGNYVQLNNWYFFATTISSTNIINYQILMDSNNKAINLSPINSSPGSYSIGTNTQSVSIGKHLNGQYPYWSDAEMDELVLFNRALSSAELLTIYEYIFGYPTNILNVESNNQTFKVNTACNNLFIESKSIGYDVEIYNVFGQVLARKTNCDLFEQISINLSTRDIILIKITDREKSIYHYKKMIN